MKIRRSTGSDLAAMSAIHADAFGPEEGPEIVELVNELLDDETAKPLLSLVAETDGKVVGHILFTAVKLEGSDQELSMQILAPLAVSSHTQRAGVGGTLIKEGMRQLTALGVDLVFVLGHPAYYPKFGFQTAGVAGFEAPYPIPAKNADAWMVQALRGGVIGSVRGTVQCSEALDQPHYWVE